VLPKKILFLHHPLIPSVVMSTYTELPRSSGEVDFPSSDSDSSWSIESADLHLENAFSEKSGSSSKWPCLPYLRRKLLLIGLAILPSYLSNRITGQTHESKNSQNVASLDGLRGIACLFVLNQHFSYSYSQAFLHGWNGTEGREWIIQLPIVRILWSGNAMVAVFFVISGYVLSYKPLKQMQRNSDQVLQTISSAIVRRGIRLYLPSFIATFMCMLLLQAGAFERGRGAFNQKYTLLSANEAPPIRFATFSEQFWDWWGTVTKMLYPWTWQDTWQSYDLHLWTIPTEFRGSMLLFLIHCGVARLRLAFRVAVLATLVAYTAYTDVEQMVLFLVGMLVAQIDVILRDRSEKVSWGPLAFVNDVGGQTSSPKRAAWIATFVVGLFLASTPTDYSENSTGYSFLVTNLVPQWYKVPKYFWQSIGAMLLVWSVSHSQDTKPIFTNSFAQYLGKISYALYIVHGNILRIVLYAIMPTIWDVCGDVQGSNVRFGMAWLLGAIVIVPTAFWAADLFWRLVDTPCVKFARSIEERISIEEN
jgi:peptidoglycan/LPS O-acetylase OafA/YrhL